MSRIALSFTNPELIKNLLYILERKVEPDSFEYDQNTNSLIVSKNLSTLEALVRQFSQKSLRIVDRIKSNTIFAKDFPAISSKDNLAFNGQYSKTDTPGVFVLWKDATAAIEALDEIFSRFAKSAGAETGQFPSIVSRATLERAGYLPREKHQIGEIHTHGADGDGSLNNAQCLTPALCLGLYPVFNNQRIKNALFTAHGMVHRYEGGVFSSDLPFLRMREYHVREIVGFGAHKDFDLFKKKCTKFLDSFSDHFELPAILLPASDLFFHTEYVGQAVNQIVQKSKLEYRIKIGEFDSACASINFHDTHFTEKFEIAGHDHNSDLISFCMGFGLERLAQAFILKFPQPAERIQKLEHFLRDHKWSNYK